MSIQSLGRPITRGLVLPGSAHEKQDRFYIAARLWELPVGLRTSAAWDQGFWPEGVAEYPPGHQSETHTTSRTGKNGEFADWLCWVDTLDLDYWWTPAEHLRVGHVVHSYSSAARPGPAPNMLPDPPAPCVVTRIYDVGGVERVEAKHMLRGDIIPFGHLHPYMWLTTLDLTYHHGADHITVTHPGPAAPKPPSQWNAKCPKCGKGVYHGLFKVEHEGGGCP